MTDGSSEGFGLSQKVMHEIIVDANGDSRLPGLFGFRGDDPAPLTLAEIVSLLHPSPVICTSCPYYKRSSEAAIRRQQPVRGVGAHGHAPLHEPVARPHVPERTSAAGRNMCVKGMKH
jgi:hypothetical protein